jgi:hypothetical protein
MAIVHEHLTGVTIDADQLEKVAMDAGVLEALKDVTMPLLLALCITCG